MRCAEFAITVVYFMVMSLVVSINPTTNSFYFFEMDAAICGRRLVRTLISFSIRIYCWILMIEKLKLGRIGDE